jgi:hypothetical protein
VSFDPRKPLKIGPGSRGSKLTLCGTPIPGQGSGSVCCTLDECVGDKCVNADYRGQPSAFIGTDRKVCSRLLGDLPIRMCLEWIATMTRNITIMALTAGIVLGATATEGFNVYRQSHDSRIFQERVRCKAVADAYVKENSTDFKEGPFESGVTVTLDKVDYSPARNSCVAELNTTYYSQRVALANWEKVSVQDLLSGESLFSANSKDEDFHASQDIFLPRVWEYVITNASEPLELESERSRLQSMLAPKSASPPPWTQWDAKGNPIPDSKRPPSGLTPDATASQHLATQPQLVDPYAQSAKQPPPKPKNSAPPSGP